MLKTLTFALCLSLGLWLHSSASAAFVFTVESGTFTADLVNPTLGSVNVFVTADPGDLPFTAGSYQASVQASGFTGSITNITYQPATTADGAHPPLFPNPPATIAAPPGFFTASSALGEPPSTLSNGSGLYKLNFTVPTGQFGTFQINVVNSGGAFSDLTNQNGDSQTLGFGSGTITVNVAAVPEPATLGLGGLALVGGAAAWKRRRGKKAFA